jgi:transposase
LEEEFGWEILEHPPYSPDLAPSDYHLFRSMEHWLRGKKFGTDIELHNSVIHFFNSKGSEFYQRGIDLLPEKWQEVIEIDGEYFDS